MWEREIRMVLPIFEATDGGGRTGSRANGRKREM